MSAQLPTHFLQKTFENVLSKEGFDPRSPYKLSSDIPRLWMSRVFRVTVYPEGKDQRNFFIKCLPTDDAKVEALNIREIFINESVFYNSVVPSFLELGPYVGVPRCYSAICAEDCVLVLEDLSSLGFKAPSRLRDLTLGELRAILQEVGRLHGFSLALREKRPSVFEHLKSTVRKVKFNAQLNTLLNFANADAMKLLQASFPEDSSYVTLYSKYVESGVLSHVERALHTDNTDDKYDVLSHVDLWASNVMLRSDPDEARLIDFQSCRFCPAGLDLAYVFFTSTHKKMRETHGDELLKSYKSSLHDTLRSLDLDPEQILPQKALDKILMPKGALYALAVGVQNIVFTLDDGKTSEQDLELNGDLLATLKEPFYHKTRKCEQRLLDLITDVIDRGYLDFLKTTE